jgi:hypothetical protein
VSAAARADDLSGYSSDVDPRVPPDPILGLEERRRKEREAVEEAGGGEREGFELSEQDLIQHASHGDEKASTRIMLEAGRQEEPADTVYGEADEERPPD